MANTPICWKCKSSEQFTEKKDAAGHPYLLCECGASTTSIKPKGIKKAGK